MRTPGSVGAPGEQSPGATRPAKPPDDSDLGRIVTGFRDSCAHIKLHRHKLVGHSDLNTRLGLSTIPRNTSEELDAIIGQAECILRHVALKYGDTDIAFGTPPSVGAEALLYWLRKAHDHRMDIPNASQSS